MSLFCSSEDVKALLRAPRPKPPRQSPRAVAKVKQLRTLDAISRYGHLRCAEIAAAVFPSAKYSVQLSQRVVKKLLARGQIASRRNSLGTTSYVLTRRGAAELELNGKAARHGLDISAVTGGTCRHSVLCARYCIEQEKVGFTAWHEYAILQGRAPISKEQLIESYGKLPDAVLIKADKLWLVEVESAAKSTDTLSRICSVVGRVGRRLHHNVNLELQGVIFVFDGSLGHAVRIARAARNIWVDRCLAEQRELAARIAICRVDIGLPLVWRGYKTEVLSI